MKWLHRSADQGHGLAYYNLGFEYSSGVLVKKNELEAIKWYKKAIKKTSQKLIINSDFFILMAILLKKIISLHGNIMNWRAEAGTVKHKMN